ncbi:MAG TPA: ATP-binding protein, partial [bacterium]|nr:ATP-binding protein [bacterium]
MIDLTRLARAPEHPALPVERLRRECAPDSFRFETTEELEASQDIIGQERALRAIKLGLEMDSPGYNIFLAGFVGTGRNTTIRQVLQRLDRNRRAPDDLCYVYNFAKPEEPAALFLPPGHGRRLCHGMEGLVRKLRRQIPSLLEQEAYGKERDRIIEKFRKRQRAAVAEFDQQVQKAGFALVQVQMGPVPTPQVVPVVDGEPKTLGDLEEAADAGDYDKGKLKALTEKLAELTQQLGVVIRNAAKIDSELQAELSSHEQQAVRPLVAARFDLLREEYADLPEVLVYLGHAEKHSLDNIRRFLDDGGDENGEADAAGDDAPVDLEYRVNVLVDNHDTQGPPVIVENAPTASRLFGIIERKWASEGERPVDHTKIQAGCLHAANGGYLVLNASDLFGEPYFVWHALKRTLRTGRLELLSDPGSFLGPPALKPQPVSISIKVVLIGDAHLYAALYAYDDDFKKIFKVRADFDTEMPHVEDNVLQYGAFVQRLVSEEGILPYHRSGLARVVEYGGRLAGRQDKLSTRFHQIADLMREAAYFAKKAGSGIVLAEHVDKALEEKDYRNNLPQEKMQEMIEEGSIFIDVTGSKIGELNGLAVYDSGEYGFGLPSKITSTVSLGNAGVINIEREADLSGRIHDKG